MFEIACVAQMRTTPAGGVMALRDPSTELRMMLWVTRQRCLISPHPPWGSWEHAEPVEVG
jgi:hypothetical protein